jgi:hypothetical protein
MQQTDAPQCLTLAPTVALMADIANDDDKRWLTDALYYLRVSSTGNARDDILKLSALIQGCGFLFLVVCIHWLRGKFSLVDELGLRSTLAEYNVPRVDVLEIATLALGEDEQRESGALHERVVELLEGLY